MQLQLQPLRWPEGQRRTLIKHREKRGQWKKPLGYYLKELEAELTKLGAVGVVITGDPDSEKFVSGVALYFSLPPKEAGEWQEILGIDNPKPTAAEIDERVKELRVRFHPENNRATGNLEMYLRVGQAGIEAHSWASGDFGKKYEKCIACDRYDQVRLNVKAIQVTIAALRRVEESGAPGYLERAFAGFAAPQLKGG